MNGNFDDPKQALSRLFSEADDGDNTPGSPFGDDPSGVNPGSRLRAAITRLRSLRSQAGSDGLTPAATRSLLDEVVAALEAVSDGLPQVDRADDTAGGRGR